MESAFQSGAFQPNSFQMASIVIICIANATDNQSYVTTAGNSTLYGVQASNKAVVSAKASDEI